VELLNGNSKDEFGFIFRIHPQDIRIRKFRNAFCGVNTTQIKNSVMSNPLNLQFLNIHLVVLGCLQSKQKIFLAVSHTAEYSPPL